MKLSDFFPTIPKEIINQMVTDLTVDHRKVIPGSLFFAIAGSKVDGHQYIGDALKSGAVACVVDQKKYSTLDSKHQKKCIPVDDVRKTLALSAAAFQNNPASKLSFFGITGTNGKTTSTYLLEKLLTKAGKKVAVLGTVENRFGDVKLTSTHTTPGPIEFHSILKQFLDLGADTVVMEVSSHSLDQDRIFGIGFEAVIFTNLTQDHLDYHHSMENYYQAKLKLFTEYDSKLRVINTDDPYGKKIFEICEKKNLPAVPFYKKTLKLKHNLIGDFNDQNLAGVLAVYAGLGFDLKKIEGKIEFKVPGRLEQVRPELGFKVFVDYAHTPDALEKALHTLKPLCLKKGRLLCLFGCGGDRDKEKRPLMGAIAENNADLVLITSDNPRGEDPTTICQEIAAGMKEPPQIEISRKSAIRKAIALLNSDDVLLIAGKGHENYQIIGDKTYHFDDREEASTALEVKSI